MSKKARIVRGNQRGLRPEEERWELRAGEKGTGKVIHSVIVWPDSPKSCEAGDKNLFFEANRLGYDIIPSYE